MNNTLKYYLDADWARLSDLAGTEGIPRRWSSHFGPRFAPVTLLRLAQVSHARGHTKIAKIASLMNFLAFNLEAPARLQIGPGLVIPHPQGIVLGAREIGANVTIFHQVTLGGKSADFSYDPARRPLVGNNVTLSAGAKILGPLTLGDGCTVGANAVVLEDVPAGAIAVGVPARMLPAGRDESDRA